MIHKRRWRRCVLRVQIVSVLAATTRMKKRGGLDGLLTNSDSRNSSSVLLRWILPRGFEEKLGSIINAMRADPAFLPPMADRVY
jgi:hypothetical protein